jgi:hypothetical protein
MPRYSLTDGRLWVSAVYGGKLPCGVAFTQTAEDACSWATTEDAVRAMQRVYTSMPEANRFQIVPSPENDG